MEIQLEYNYEVIFSPTYGGELARFSGHNLVLASGVDRILRNSFETTGTLNVPRVYLGSGTPTGTPTGIVTALAVAPPTVTLSPAGAGTSNTVTMTANFPTTYSNLDAVITEMAVYLDTAAATGGNATTTSGTAVNHITLNYDNQGSSGPNAAIDATIVFRFSS